MLRSLVEENTMPHFQQKHGLPSRPRNNDNTRWISEVDGTAHVSMRATVLMGMALAAFLFWSVTI